MTPSPLTALLAQSVPLTLKKLAKQVAFEAAAARLHAIALAIPGDADNLVEEQDMWSDKWNVAIVIDAITQREVADRLEAEARAQAGFPMAEDPAPTEPAHHTPATSKSSQATTWSKMEVALPKGKGKKRSRQDLSGDEVAVFPPEGMVIHQDPCVKCIGSTVPCHGFPGRTCQKCAGLKVKCVHSRGRAAGVTEAAEPDQTGTVPRPVCATAPVAGPSVQPRLSAGSDEGEEVVIVVRAEKGKAVSAQAKGVRVDEGDFKEIMWQLLMCESKVWDTQAWNAELEGKVLGLKAYINRLRQK
ncbi:hypothetical protein PAXRUDRAFT_20782 [Paxillus rubicundulus Ve08.2h10]|uniref:Zn(2)-C6 fungal-type domain-containing protein n=1 Tax=Paxillus rubicundulus Ve08.2h10 TaxID=930991 RepID=A0A0D0D8R8_9AGAM|nr:hypothetical protein PAXRUDRAFT_20782 [Paxillus rubicundulus Ve08.2h10]